VIVSDVAWNGGLRSLEGLKGRRIGITSGTRYILSRLAAKYGFTSQDVTTVKLPPNSIGTAFKDYNLDALISGPPLPTGGHILAWAGDEVPWQGGAICTTAAMIRDHHELLEHFLSAYTRGVSDYTAAFGKTDANGNVIKGPGADEFADLMAEKFGVQRADLGNNWPRVDPDAWLDGGEVDNQIGFWRSEGRVAKDFNPESILDRSFGKID
jgi:NitT/TauT family transport system substrate-binding protein